MDKLVTLLINVNSKESGNYNTAARIKNGLIRKDYRCQIINIGKYSHNPGDVVELCQVSHCIITIHALHAHSILSKIPCPLVLIFGGTDLYQHHKNESELEKMKKMVSSARVLVFFNQQMKTRSEDMFGELISEKASQVIPQAVDISDIDGTASIQDLVSEDCRVFLLPSGLRPVKDVLHIVREFSAWSLTLKEKAVLVIMGAVLNEDYASKVKELIETLPNVYLKPAVSRPKLLSYMKQSDAVCNTSLTEGQCSVLLEAMSLGVPLIARVNEGNSNVVGLGKYGQLYNTHQEFIDCCSNVLYKSGDIEKMIEAAQQTIHLNHNPDEEARHYDLIIQTAIDNFVFKEKSF